MKTPSPFLGRSKVYPGQKNFDKFYITPIVNKVYKKVGDTDKYVEELEIIEDKVDIRKEINSQASECGIDAYLKPYQIAGTTPPDVSVSDKIQDFSKMPDDLADAIKLGEDAKSAFSKLDPKLTGGLDLPNFLNSLTADKFINYIKSKVTPKVAPKASVSPVESEKK